MTRDWREGGCPASLRYAVLDFYLSPILARLTMRNVTPIRARIRMQPSRAHAPDGTSISSSQELLFRDTDGDALHEAGEVRIFNILEDQISRLGSLIQTNVCGFIC